MTNVIQFYRPVNRGNGAREALVQYFENPAHQNGGYPMVRADHLLAALWVEGFKIVPLDKEDESAS